MDNLIKRVIDIEVRNGDEQAEVRDSICSQLVGNEDFINNNIIVDTQDPNYVTVVIFEECKTIPKILI